MTVTTPEFSRTQVPATSQFQPGGALLRFLASMIDGMILTVIQLPITLGMGVMSARTGEQNPMMTLLSYAIGIVISSMYYCWFYKNKGGSLGKLALGLRVVDHKTGQNLSYGQTILRQTVGMWVFALSTVLLFLGPIMLILRADKRGFHDMIAGTQVLRKK